MRLPILFLLTALIAAAQLTDGVATTVSRTVTLTADEADFSIVAGADLGTTQQQVAQVFLDAGITGLSNTGTSIGQYTDYSTNQPVPQTQVVYQYAFNVPAAGLKDAARIMEGLRTNPPALLKTFQYAASLNASQATVDAMHQTLLPQLFADAQKRAQLLASAGGLKLGAVKSVSESYYAQGNSGIAYLSTAVFSTTNSGYSSGGGGTQYTFYAAVTYSVVQ